MRKLMMATPNDRSFKGTRDSWQQVPRITILCASIAVMLTACAGEAAGQSRPPASPYHLYVASTGSNANAGTRAAPLRTIQAAANLAKPGTTVHVAPGTYAESIVSTISGTSTDRIIYVSDTKWGAKIVPPSAAAPGVTTLWQAKGGYTDIVGFDMSSTGSRGVRVGIDFTGAHSSARHNRVHHLGNLPLVCGSTAGAALKSHSDPVAAGHTNFLNNVIHDIGQGATCSIHGIALSTSGNIKNNVIHNVGWAAIHLWHDARSIMVANNTVFRSYYGIIYGSGDGAYSTAPADYITVANNIVYDNVTGIRNARLGTLGSNNSIVNNLVFKNKTDWNTSSAHSGDVSAEPQFVRYDSSGNGDYRLARTSPAIDKAVLAHAPLLDHVGTRRPQGAAADLGAYEHVFGEPTKPTPTPPPPPTPTPTPPPPPTPTPPPAPTPTPAPIPLPPPLASTNHLYVAKDGSDTNSGSSTAPLKTLQRAANLAKPSTTVHVGPGIYAENVTTRTHGTAAGRIRFVSDARWAARLIGSGTEAQWINHANYVDIVGFDISGSGRQGILNWGSYTLVASNHIHHLEVSGGCNGNGGAGVVNANYSGSDGDIIGNVVNDIGVPGACNGVQGIYSSNKRGRIMNNIVFRASSYGIHLWHAADNVLVANNTVFANGSSAMGGGILIGVGDSPGGVVLNNTTVINNIAYRNPAFGIRQYCYSGQNCIGPTNTVANNLVTGNGINIRMLVGSATGTITTDPQFLNFMADGSGNYRLKDSSPAIDKGIGAPAPTYDIDYIARPRGGAHDIGAYERF